MTSSAPSASDPLGIPGYTFADLHDLTQFAVVEALADTDIHIGVPSARVARMHEIHLLTIHCLCDGIDAIRR